jgi:hypothetical protein
LTAAVVCATGAFCSPAFASWRADKAATRAYLRASAAYMRDAYSQVKASVAAVEASASHIAATCPGALTFAPRDAAFSELGEEATGTLLFAGSIPLRPIILRLAEAVGHLNWGNRALTRLVRARAAEEREIAGLAMPDMCVEIEAWKASAYAALPQGASTFVTRFMAILTSSSLGPSGEPRETIILRRLRRYEGRIERAVAKRTEALEERLSKRLSAAVTSARTKITIALGVSQL